MDILSTPRLPSHIAWLAKDSTTKQTACGRSIEIWRLTPEADDAVLSAWAKHFRQHYCKDADLDALVQGTGKSKAEYLREIVFPDQKLAPGPSIRAGDFAEILISDYVEYVLNFWCPRLRYDEKWVRNESTKGCDIVGFTFTTETEWNADDRLIIFEAKSGLSATDKNRLQDAIADSIKDRLREAFTLNAFKRRLLKEGQTSQASAVERFQNEADRPFQRINGAAALLDDDVFAETDFGAVDASAHPNSDGLRLLVIRGPSLMDLVNTIYARATHEA